jgi:hypothetical protein
MALVYLQPNVIWPSKYVWNPPKYPTVPQLREVLTGPYGYHPQDEVRTIHLCERNETEFRGPSLRHPSSCRLLHHRHQLRVHLNHRFPPLLRSSQNPCNRKPLKLGTTSITARNSMFMTFEAAPPSFCGPWHSRIAPPLSKLKRW